MGVRGKEILAENFGQTVHVKQEAVGEDGAVDPSDVERRREDEFDKPSEDEGQSETKVPALQCKSKHICGGRLLPVTEGEGTNADVSASTKGL